MKVAIAGPHVEVGNYLEALRFAGIDAQADVVMPSDEPYDGLVLPGGGDIDPALYGSRTFGSLGMDRQLDEWQLHALDLFVRAGKPVLGICKGEQIINVYFGGDIIQHLPTAEDHRRIDSCDSIHESSAEPGSILHTLYGARFVTNSAHHQGVGRVGEGLRVISRCVQDDVVEAVVHERLPILGLQWHPERMCFRKRRPDTVDGEPVLDYFKSLMECEQTDDGKADS